MNEEGYMMDDVTFFDYTKTLITGGTGSFGHALVDYLLAVSTSAKIIVFSRDEYKQYIMKQQYPDAVRSNRLSFVIGDVRNRDRLILACRNVDFVFHAAALKQIPTCEDNVEEAILTNINGGINVRNAADFCHVKKVVALSTDKAVQPVNLYGATKMVSDKLFTDMTYCNNTVFCIVRYGNVAETRGSVIPLFKQIYSEGKHDYPVTDVRMTRFWISLSDAVKLAVTALKESCGGETFVAKLPSFRITDLITAIDPKGRISVIGIRPGEKIDELMITKNDAYKTVDYGNYYVIFASENAVHNCSEKLVPENFEYSSHKNTNRLTVETLRDFLYGETNVG
jgi:FlaA1/EpsC-like NDP-sugar epimerase